MENITQIPTREQVEALKHNWRQDACWDLYESEGFEEYRDELKAYQEAMEKIWDEQYKEQCKNEAESMGLIWPDQHKIYGTLKGLQQRIIALEEKVFYQS